MTRRTGCGMSLLEVLVALAILATGVTALQRLLVQSVGAVNANAERTRAMLAARTLLAEAELVPHPPGRPAGDLGAGGLHFERDVRATAHPRLHEVRVRVTSERDQAGCELVELIRVPSG